jgi:NH3-dependent NAD+ synthetase
MEFNPQKQLAGLLEWMDQQMTQCGGKTAVIGISGGKDSSTVAALAVAAYGRENVYGVLMPNGVQPTSTIPRPWWSTCRSPIAPSTSTTPFRAFCGRWRRRA